LRLNLLVLSSASCRCVRSMACGMEKLATLHFDACRRLQSDQSHAEETASFTLDIADKLGTGACSVVYRLGLACTESDDTERSRPLAAKFLLHRDGCRDPHEPREAKMLMLASGNRYILKCLGLFEVDLDAQPKLRGFFARTSSHKAPKTAIDETPPSRGFFLLEELCCCTLHDLVEHVSFKESEAAFALHSALCGLMHLHALGILHRDIKTANIMVSDGGLRVILGDFDLAACLPDDSAEMAWNCGTAGYLAPEVYGSHKGSKATDLFALGVVLYILLTKSQPFLRETPLLTELATRDGRLSIEPETLQMFRSHEACDLLLWLLEPRPEHRPEASEALESEWLCIREPESEGVRALVRQWSRTDSLEQKLATSETKSPDVRNTYSAVHSSIKEQLRRNFTSSSFLMRSSKKQARNERDSRRLFRTTFASSARSALGSAALAMGWRKRTKVKPVDEADEFDSVFIP